MGEAATRAAAAAALLIVADSMAGASDSETLRQLVVAMDGVLAGGCLDKISPRSSFSLQWAPPSVCGPAGRQSVGHWAHLINHAFDVSSLCPAVGTAEYADSTSNLSAWNRCAS